MAQYRSVPQNCLNWPLTHWIFLFYFYFSINLFLNEFTFILYRFTFSLAVTPMVKIQYRSSRNSTFTFREIVMPPIRTALSSDYIFLQTAGQDPSPFPGTRATPPRQKAHDNDQRGEWANWRPPAVLCVPSGNPSSFPPFSFTRSVGILRQFLIYLGFCSLVVCDPDSLSRSNFQNENPRRQKKLCYNNISSAPKAGLFLKATSKIKVLSYSKTEFLKKHNKMFYYKICLKRLDINRQYEHLYALLSYKSLKKKLIQKCFTG